MKCDLENLNIGPIFLGWVLSVSAIFQSSAARGEVGTQDVEGLGVG